MRHLLSRPILLCLLSASSPVSIAPQEFIDRLPVPAAVCWTALVVALSLFLWLALRRTRWGAAAGWLALALAGQACSLQLLWVGPQIRLQLFYEWRTLLNSYRGIFLLALVLQAALVIGGARKLWPAVRSYLPPILGWWQAIVLLALAAYAAITIAPGVAQAYVGGGFPGQFARHATKMMLGLLIFGVGTLNLALATTAIPSDVWEQVLARWQRMNRERLPWLCALWVVVVSSLLAWFVLDGMPHIPDEVAYLFQAKCISTGRIFLPPPPVPEAFFCPFQLVDASKWSNAMPAGWPFILAAGVWAGVPWLVNPLLGGIAILLAHAWVRLLYDRAMADGVVLLLAASPWFLFMSANLMVHAVSLVFALLGLLGVARAREGGSLGWAALSGVSFGAMLHVRPLEAVIIAGVAGLWWLSGGWKKLRFVSLFVATLGGLAMAGLFLSYNKALTGSATLLPLDQFMDTTYYKGSNRLGFGRDIGNWGWTGLDALPGHGPIDVVMNTNQNLYLVNFELFGWASGSLLFVFLLLAWGRLRSDGLMWSILVATWAVMSLYWFSGGPDFGARYWYQMIVPLAVLTVRGAQALAARWREGAGPSAPAATGTRVWAFVGLASLLGLVNLLPWRSLDKYHYYRGMRPDIRKLASEYKFRHSLVLIRGSRWPDYAAAFSFNPPTFGREAKGPIYARDLGPEVTERLRSYYSDRPVWILAGPTETREGFRVINGPLRPGEPLRAEEPAGR